MAAGHTTKGEVEGTLCREMERQGLVHAHRSLHFRVRPASGEAQAFEPDIVVHRGPILFLLVCLDDDARREARAALLARFLEQHSPEIVMVAVAPSAAIPDIPQAAYDEIYADSELASVVRRIREQDPHGMIRPFAKPPSRAR